MYDSNAYPELILAVARDKIADRERRVRRQARRRVWRRQMWDRARDLWRAVGRGRR